MSIDRLNQLAQQLNLLQEQLAGLEQAKILSPLEEQVRLGQRIVALRQKIRAIEQEYQETEGKNQETSIPQNLPYSGITQFVGWQVELGQLHQQLQPGRLVAISAVSGMGGIDKTELAQEYAHQQ